MNKSLRTERIYRIQGREATFQKLQNLTTPNTNLYVIFDDEIIREFPRQALNNSFYEGINKTLQPIEYHLGLLESSKNIIENSWNQKAFEVRKTINNLEQAIENHITPWVEEHFPAINPKPRIDQSYTDDSISYLANEPKQTIHRYVPLSSANQSDNYTNLITSL